MMNPGKRLKIKMGKTVWGFNFSIVMKEVKIKIGFMIWMVIMKNDIAAHRETLWHNIRKS